MSISQQIVPGTQLWQTGMRRGRVFAVIMKGTRAPGTEAERQAAALAEAEKYCEEHPRSPSAKQRPRILLRGSTFVALLGSSLEDGVAGLGGTVAAALRAFDVCYSNSLKPSRG